MSTLSAMAISDPKQDARILIFSLLVACPINITPGTDCPFSKKREAYPIEEKYKYAENLSDVEVASLLKLHEECYERQIKAIKWAARSVMPAACH